MKRLLRATLAVVVSSSLVVVYPSVAGAESPENTVFSDEASQHDLALEMTTAGDMQMHHDMSMISPDSDASYVKTQVPLAPKGWTATADSANVRYPASNAIDGKTDTFWHTEYGTRTTPFPHTFTIDMHVTTSIGGVTYLPRQDSSLNGTIGGYRVALSANGSTWIDPVLGGVWADDKAKKTVQFPSTVARFVRVTALTEAGGRGSLSSAAEIGLLGGPMNLSVLPRAGWMASASDELATHAASAAIDGRGETFWHSGSGKALPHDLTIDLGTSQNVSGVSYMPRQDGSPNGRVGRYSISVSTDGQTWSAPAVSGRWADTNSIKYALFSSMLNTRFLRLTATTEAGNRGSWSSAAELSVFGSPVKLVPLSRSGWTIAADSQRSDHVAETLIDGNANSFWHTPTGTGAKKYPHSVTIDMKEPRQVSGLQYLPRQDTSANGRIGRWSISLSSDGENWGAPVGNGIWPDDTREKFTTFSSIAARYLRLTAYSEAGNRGPWASGAEIEVLGPQPAVGSGGAWSKPIGLPLVPVSAALLPNNKLLTFSAVSDTKFTTSGTTTRVAIIDLNTGQVSRPKTVDTDHEMFCTGLAMLADGRLLINGGSTDGATTIYNPADDSWSIGPKMNIPRAYQGDTTLSTGEVFTLGGSWRDRAGSKNGEVFTPSGVTGTWRRLSGVPALPAQTNDPAGVVRSDNHMWLFAVSGGAVFQAGPSRTMHWITTSGSGTMTDAGTRGDSPDAMNGNAVMYDVNKILTLGGAYAYNNVQATRRADVIQVGSTAGSPVTSHRVGDMTYARSFSTSVVFPDGKVGVFGGQQYPRGFTDTSPTAPELWDPATGAFTVLSSQSVPRTYHNVALLLPDGRVFLGGGGLCGTCTTNHPDGEFFTPPYLLNADGSPRSRPGIQDAPAVIPVGSTAYVTTSGNTPAFALVRTSSVTHSVNNDQRRISLAPTAVNGNTYTLQIPGDSGVALPGDYLLFALDAAGTPSVARQVSIR